MIVTRFEKMPGGGGAVRRLGHGILGRLGVGRSALGAGRSGGRERNRGKGEG